MCIFYNYIYVYKTKKFIGIGSSKIGEDSLSHHGDSGIGVYVIDRYTYYVLEFLEKFQPRSRQPLLTTVGHFLEVCPKRLCISTVSARIDLYERNPYHVPLSDFFGNVADLKMIDNENGNNDGNYNYITNNNNSYQYQQKSSIFTGSNMVSDSSSWILVDPFLEVMKQL